MQEFIIRGAQLLDRCLKMLFSKRSALCGRGGCLC